MDHKKFFVKDFIQYASPCFGCGKPLSLQLVFKNKQGDEGGNLNMARTDKHLEIDLSIRYTSQLRLFIMYKSNTFLVNDRVAFSHYIAKRDLKLMAECSCNSWYESNNLDFQTFNGAIGALTLRKERIVVVEKDKIYTLRSDFSEEKTDVSVSSTISSQFITKNINLQLPLLPKYKLRDKQQLIKKIQTYILFS